MTNTQQTEYKAMKNTENPSTEQLEALKAWAALYGRTSLTMTLEQAQSASHSGACDADVKALSEVPAIAAQLATFDPAEVAQDLREYGAWSTEELLDHDQNLQRLLWLAAGNIREDNDKQYKGIERVES